MKVVRLEVKNKIALSGIAGFFKKKVTKFGTGAKIDIPKEHLGKRVVILVCND